MDEQQQKTIQTYNNIATKFSSGHFDHFWVEEFDKYKKLLGLSKKVLDIGCGAGRDAVQFVKEGFDYTGIDASEGMLKVAEERVPKGNFIKMDLYKLDFPNDSFDGFWAVASFPHVPKKYIEVALKEALRVIKPDGIGFIAIKEKTILEEGFIEEEKYQGQGRFFAFYDKDEFGDILKRDNFNIIEVSSRYENDENKTHWLCYFVRK